jgi:hypothetical protein
MATQERTCPKCKSAMELHEDDPDVGLVGAWICTDEDCDYTEPPEYEDWHDEFGFLGL